MSRGNKGEFNTLAAKTGYIQNITSTGTLTTNKVSVSSTYYKSVFLGLASFSTAVTQAAALASVLASTSLSSTLFTYGWFFDKDAGEVLAFNFAMPTDYAEGTPITPYVIWGTTSSTGSTGGGSTAQQYVAWTLGYTVINLDSTSTSALAGPTEETIFAACSSSVLKIQSTAFTAISPTHAEVDSIISGYIARNATASTDGLDKDAILHGLSFRYFVDGMGSTSTISDK